MTERTLLIPLALGLGLIAASPAQWSSPAPSESTVASLAASHAPDAVSTVESVANGDDPFLTADRCIACHKGVSTSQGEDVSIGYDWRASMMANSARDPYWQAAVRRELIDHPEATAAIEDKCGRCHMPMPNVVDRSAGGLGSIFSNLAGGSSGDRAQMLAADGVSCAVCHQVQPDGLGTEASYTGGFSIAAESPDDGRPMFGPFEPDQGGEGIMHSATGYRPAEGTHVQSSELCASCHTLFTHALRTDGDEGPEFPEQVPYLEWQASRYAETGESCQDCHMPEVEEEVPVTGVLGKRRPNVSRHVFRGGNFFMIRMLNRYRAELGVTALPQEMALAADRTEEHLRTSTAGVTISNAGRDGDRVAFDVSVENRSGHKFPTAYPSRRAWLNVSVTDSEGRQLFESGAFSPDGRIVGNDNDEDGSRYEPHYTEITDEDQVQVYEAVMVGRDGAVTTGLMNGEGWAKDNRLLPAGFDAPRTDRRIGVFGAARDDGSFSGGGDSVHYSVDVGSAQGPLTLSAELWFQPIAYRWAHNLAEYESFETDRFVRYYTSMAPSSAIVVADTEETVR